MLRAAAGALMARGASRAVAAAARGASTKAPVNSAAEKVRFQVPSRSPSPMDRRILLWSGRFRRDEDIPERVTFEMIERARNKLRIRMCYLMIALTLAGCVGMVISGKQAVRRHDSLSGMNLEKKSQMRAEAQQELQLSSASR